MPTRLPALLGLSLCSALAACAAPQTEPAKTPVELAEPTSAEPTQDGDAAATEGTAPPPSKSEKEGNDGSGSSSPIPGG